MMVANCLEMLLFLLFLPSPLIESDFYYLDK